MQTPAPIYEWLCEECEQLAEQLPAAWVYHPLRYARAVWQQYLERYATTPGVVVMVGMNPGPFGMAQTGVPFGDVPSVRDWLGLQAPVGRPAREHPRRPVLGWDCPRREVSGRRLWGWAQTGWCQPERFFRQFLVVNYCPLLLLDEAGRNLTPDRMKGPGIRRLTEVCDDALRRLVQLLESPAVIGIGNYAHARLEAIFAGVGQPRRIRLDHPSPANPRANQNWARLATATLSGAGLLTDAQTRDGLGQEPTA